MGKRKNYESPFIERAQVETESGFCAASVVNEKKSEVVSAGQEEGNSYDASKEWQGGWE